MNRLPYKIFDTGKRKYMYLPFNSRFYPVTDGDLKILPLALSDRAGSPQRLPASTKRALSRFHGKHPDIADMLKRYRTFVFMNPIQTPLYISTLQSGLDTCVLCMTEQCNLRCTYCCYSEFYDTPRRYSETTMSLKVAKEAVRLLKLSSGDIDGEKTIGFYGGEPMLNFRVMKQVVAYAKRLFRNDKLVFSITTNGTVLNREMVRFLIRNKFRVAFSLDGPQHMTDRFRRFGGNSRSVFEQIMKNLRMIRDMDRKFFLNNVIYNSVISAPLDFDEMEDFFRKEVKTRSINVGFSDISPLHTCFFEAYPNVSKYDDQIATHRKRYEQTLIDGVKYDRRQCSMFYHFLRGASIRIHKRSMLDIDMTWPFPTGQCLPGAKKFYVRPSGDMYICEKFDQDYNIGDVFEGFDLDRIHFLLDDYYEDMQKTCKDCWAQRLCSICIVPVFTDGKFDKKAKNRECSFQRKYFTREITRYLKITEKNPNAFEFLDKWTYG